VTRDRLYRRVEVTAWVVIVLSSLVIAISSLGCAPTPKPLSPAATAAFHATRVVAVLDVFRDATIAANELVPPAVTTDSTRTVVLWHKTAVQVIQAVPTGWQATVKAGLYALTCHPLAAPAVPIACTPQLKPEEVTRLAPYVGLVIVVINEVK